MNGFCRCGWNGTGDHPCHRCHKAPGSTRFYDPRLVPLAGVQMKFEVRDTNACDPCWEEFQREIEAERKAYQEALANSEECLCETS